MRGHLRIIIEEYQRPSSPRGTTAHRVEAAYTGNKFVVWNIPDVPIAPRPEGKIRDNGFPFSSPLGKPCTPDRAQPGIEVKFTDDLLPWIKDSTTNNRGSLRGSRKCEIVPGRTEKISDVEQVRIAMNKTDSLPERVTRVEIGPLAKHGSFRMQNRGT